MSAHDRIPGHRLGDEGTPWTDGQPEYHRQRRSRDLGQMIRRQHDFDMEVVCEMRRLGLGPDDPVTPAFDNVLRRWGFDPEDFR